MNEETISQVMLIRSVEEADPERFDSRTLAEAMDSMGDTASQEASIAKRALYLFSQLPETLQKMIHLTQLPLIWMMAAFAAFLIGLSSNFLGPSDRFHIIYNPIIILTAWNLLVFSLLLGLRIIRLKNSPKALRVMSPDSPDRCHDGQTHDGVQQTAGEVQVPLRYRLLKSLWLGVNQLIEKLGARKSRLTAESGVVYRFWDHYFEVCTPVFAGRMRSAVHISAIGLILGALAGTYLRGLFTEYTVVWRSSFINDPDAIRVILNMLLGIPAYLVSGHLVETRAVAQLTSATGAQAANWIHILAVASFLFIVAPRSLLLFIEARAIRKRSASLELNLADPYFMTLIQKRREMRIKSLRDRLEPLVSVEISRFSEAIAVYVRDRLFNKIIVPKIREFRDYGGRIADLERNIETTCREFESELDAYIADVQDNCQTSLSKEVTRLIGKEVSATDMAIYYDNLKKGEISTHRVGDDVASEIGGAITATVTIAVACSVATISGGFGKTLGVALIATILHTSGPVGWVVGAVIGLLAAGGVSWMARDRLTDAVKDRTIPPILTRTILSDERLAKKLEEGGQKVYTDIKEELEKNLAPSVTKLTEKILDEVTEGLRAGSQASDGRGHA